MKINHLKMTSFRLHLNRSLGIAIQSYLIKIWALFFVINCIQAESEDSTHTSLQELVLNNRYSLKIENNNLSHEGGIKLLNEAKKVDLFMFGENHGIKEIAQLSQVIYSEISKKSPRILVTEIGPTTAREVWELMGSKAYEEFMGKGMNLYAVPFFFLEQEVPLLYQVKNSFSETDQALWGLDQEFMAGAPIILRRLEKLAKTGAEISIVNKAYRQDFLNPFMIGMGNGKILYELQNVFSKSESKEARNITEQLLHSFKIYQANSDGRHRWSNETRETLMMSNFEQYVSEYKDSIPPMYFKLGSFHLHKGTSPTVREALGYRLYKWAKERNKTTLNVFVDAVDGKTINPLTGLKTTLKSKSSWKASVFNGMLLNNQPTLFDLRPLKKHLELANIPRNMRLMINGYDYLILFPKAEAQNFLQGTLVTYGYGIPILLFVSIIVIILVKWFIKILKRYGRKHQRKIQ